MNSDLGPIEGRTLAAVPVPRYRAKQLDVVQINATYASD